MNKTSLRALGALSLAKKHGTVNPEELADYVTDSAKNIEHSLKEAHTAGAVFPVPEPVDDGLENYGSRSLEKRIYGLFGNHKAYETIAWFLTESGLGTDTSDEYLKGLVHMEFEAARAVRLWDRNVVKSAFYEVKSKKSGDHIFLQDILDVLAKRSKGYE